MTTNTVLVKFNNAASAKVEAVRVAEQEILDAETMHGKPVGSKVVLELYRDHMKE